MNAREVIYPDGVETVDEIEETGPLVRLSREVDLDDLMLALAQQFGEGFVDSDFPTYVAGAYDRTEVSVGWYRKQPCNCSDGHSWDMAEVDRDEKPTGPKARGAFLGVYLG